jgi:hypothetical protein
VLALRCNESYLFCSIHGSLSIQLRKLSLVVADCSRVKGVPGNQFVNEFDQFGDVLVSGMEVEAPARC